MSSAVAHNHIFLHRFLEARLFNDHNVLARLHEIEDVVSVAVSDWRVTSAPVCVFRSTTLAPGRAAPASSETVPCTLPR